MLCSIIKMEYWKINTEFDYQKKSWLGNRILYELNKHLQKREYQCWGFDKVTVQSPCNHKYLIKKVSNKNIVSVLIENNSNRQLRGVEYPQIVKLVEDYFKMNKDIWYLLETLNSKEDKQISKEDRKISPLIISNEIKSRDKSVKPKKVEVVHIGSYHYSQTDIYKGSKDNFDSILSFWISCIYWISCGEIKERDFSFFLSRGYFDRYFGSCIPIRDENENFNAVLKYIREESKNWNQEKLKIGLLMRKDWNDKMYLMEFENEYILYNWHTSE